MNLRKMFVWTSYERLMYVYFKLVVIGKNVSLCSFLISVKFYSFVSVIVVTVVGYQPAVWTRVCTVIMGVQSQQPHLWRGYKVS